MPRRSNKRSKSMCKYRRSCRLPTSRRQPRFRSASLADLPSDILGNIIPKIGVCNVNMEHVSKRFAKVYDSVQKLTETPFDIENKQICHGKIFVFDHLPHEFQQITPSPQITLGDMVTLKKALILGALWMCETLVLKGHGFGNEGLKVLSEALGEGALSRCETLHLNMNQIGDKGLEALSGALGKGALPRCTELLVDENQIGHIGMAAFVQVVKPVSEGGSGALAQCKKLRLTNNQIGDKGLEDLSQALGMGAMAQLKILNLDSNRIGDVGTTALAQAIKPVSEGGRGALSKCRLLSLGHNRIQDKGYKALAVAIDKGALASLGVLLVDDDEHPELMVSCQTRHIAPF